MTTPDVHVDLAPLSPEGEEIHWIQWSIFDCSMSTLSEPSSFLRSCGAAEPRSASPSGAYDQHPEGAIGRPYAHRHEFELLPDQTPPATSNGEGCSSHRGKRWTIPTLLADPTNG